MEQDLNTKNYNHYENNIENQQHFENNKKKFNKQCQLVYDLLMNGKRLTTRSALIEHGIGDLRRRVKDLKDIYKVNVQSKMIGKQFKEYFINKEVK